MEYRKSTKLRVDNQAAFFQFSQHNFYNFGKINYFLSHFAYLYTYLYTDRLLRLHLVTLKRA